MKKVLAIMGSPRKNKNTDILLNNVLEGIKTTKCEILKFNLCDLILTPCTACNYCSEYGKCCINDDMYSLYNAIIDCDAIVLASPIYFNTVTSLTKIMIDRCQMFWNNKKVLHNYTTNDNKKRIGLFISTSGSTYTEEMFCSTQATIKLFFKIINSDYKYNFYACNTDKKIISEQTGVLKSAYELGKIFIK